MTRKFKLLFSFMLALSLCLGSYAGSFAIDQPAAKTSEAAITKILQIPYGTDVPSTMSFKFEVKAVSEDEAEPSKDMPEIGTNGVVTINFDGKQAEIDTVDGISSYYLESDELFGKVTWPHAGVYEYLITETSGTYTINTTPPPTESITYSQAEYTVIVYVIENEDGELEITHIGAIKIKDDDGTEVDEEEQEKSDPTPGGNGGDGEDGYSQMIFVNSYVKTNNGIDPEDSDDWTLAISKKVTGSFSDKSVYFDYKLTIKTPSLISGNPVYKAYVVEEIPENSGKFKIVTSADNGAVNGNDYIEFVSGTEKAFSLKHNQYLVFIDTPVGTSYAITELATTGYTPSVTVVYDDTTSVADTTSGSVGSPLTIPNTNIKNTMTFVSEDGSSANFVNDRGTITPTGVNLSNLPFIGMIILALGIIVGFVIMKSRKSKGEKYN